MVRKHVGYARYDTGEAVELLNELYDRLRVVVNFVRPCAKLTEKTRRGARLTRRYDRLQTPFERVLACEQLSEAAKQRLREQFAAIDSIALNDQIVRLQRRLLRLVAECATPMARAGCWAFAVRTGTSPRFPPRPRLSTYPQVHTPPPRTPPPLPPPAIEWMFG